MLCMSLSGIHIAGNIQNGGCHEGLTTRRYHRVSPVRTSRCAVGWGGDVGHQLRCDGAMQ